MKKRLLFLLTTAALFWLVAKPVLATDPHLSLSPVNGSYDTLFTLDVKVDTGGQAAGGVDVYITFPKAMLQVQDVIAGDAMPGFSSLIENNGGRVRLNAYFPLDQADQSFTGADGLVAQIKFTPLSSGSADISFICESDATNDSNIIAKSDNRDLIICNSNINGTYTITGNNVGGGSTTPTGTGSLTTITPTGTGSSGTITPTPSIPVSGSTLQTIGLIGVGLLTILTGLVLVF